MLGSSSRKSRNSDELNKKYMEGYCAGVEYGRKDTIRKNATAEQIRDAFGFEPAIKENDICGGTRMIKLGVEEYCHGCNAFTPEVDNMYLSNTVIVCAKREFCSRMKEYLERKIREENRHE